MEKEIIDYTAKPLKINTESINFLSSHTWHKEHFHDIAEIVYINSGEACVHINNEKIHMKSDDIILINRNCISLRFFFRAIFPPYL